MTTTETPHDIVSLLTADHRAVEQLFETSGTAITRESEEFALLTEELVRHEVAEEVVVYPAITSTADGQRIADACLDEQATAEQLLADMEKQEDPVAFGASLDQLRAAVLAHAAHEERDVFPLLAEADASQQAALSARYESAKTKAPTHPHPHTPDTPPGNTILGPVAALADRWRDAMRNH